MMNLGFVFKEDGTYYQLRSLSQKELSAFAENTQHPNRKLNGKRTKKAVCFWKFWRW
jgi:hypothetical protein